MLCGAPDFNITHKNVLLGYIETKDISTNLDEMEQGKGPHGNQFIRYRDGLPNWILTDYLEFRWFVNGKKRLTARIAKLDANSKIKPTQDGEQKLGQLFNAFLKEPALTVATAKDLAVSMAHMTRIVRDQIIESFKQEAEETERRRVKEEAAGYGPSPSAPGPWLHNWLAAFRETLIPDLNEGQFADMFAQTLAYGLFAARVHGPSNKAFSREMAAYNLPKTNPFLRKLFAEIAGVDMPDSIAWAVNDIVELLKHSDMFEILKDFGKGKGKEDPVVHFYETFLAAYDPKMRELRGVYYTPEPVVSYIVRSIDHLLKTRFNRPKGLADENTLILDPATGTATFLYFVIDHIHQSFAKQKGAWDDYVAQHLLNRIFGFELLMAPYAVAHLKLGIQLEQTGYQFGSDQRLGIFLTNTLEEAAKKSEQLFASWVAEEANAAAKIKRDEPILVVLGNPPYSKFSANRSEDENGKPTFIGKLIEDYKFVDGKPLGERNPKWLQDDYIKFIRFAQWRIGRTGEGIIGFITNHGYLDNPTFRGLRQSLLKSFNEIYIHNLHGNVRKKEKSPDGSEDKNVFDIQQGVAILLCIKQKGDAKPARVHYADLWGSRKSKYDRLNETDISMMRWTKCNPTPPFHLFLPQNTELVREYEDCCLVTKIFGVYASTVTTARNDFTMAHDPETLVKRVSDLRDRAIDDEVLREKYGLRDVSYWTLSSARKRLFELKNLPSFVKPYCYRPFDFRFVFYHEAICERPRAEVMQHMKEANLALLTHRPQSPSNFTYAYCTNMIGDQCVAANKTGGGGNSFQFPLYLFPSELHAETDRRPNLTPVFLKAIAEKLRLPQEEPYGLPKGITPEDIFYYAYAMFHSPTYRTRYAEFLKIDFARLPLTSDLKLFRALAAKGGELVALHLMESPKLHNLITEFPEKGDNVVEKVQYKDKDNRAWINKTQYFDGVPLTVWEFYIGGYQVCERWLKDRKGRKLSCDDIQHYQKIVVALNETIRLMAEIDGLIPSWPII
jgi:predicted helicase